LVIFTFCVALSELFLSEDILLATDFYYVEYIIILKDFQRV